MDRYDPQNPQYDQPYEDRLYDPQYDDQYTQQPYDQQYDDQQTQLLNDQQYEDQQYDQSYDQQSYDQQSYDQQSYDQQSYDQQSYDQQSYDQQSYDQQPYYEEPYYEQSYGNVPTAPKKSSGKGLNIALICIGVVAVLLVLGFFFIHVWTEGSCTVSPVCQICGKVKEVAPGHQWEEATCHTPRTCSVCGEEKGDVLTHNWQLPTCDTPQTCAYCGDTEGLPLGHSWQEATCEIPMTCSVCGMTDGEPAPHAWMDATYVAPKTCSACGLTEGEPIVPDFVFLYELEPSQRHGKFWLLSSVEPGYRYHTGRDTPRCWSDLDTPGYTGGVVRDNKGNVYTYGFHLDGDTSSLYHVTYAVNGNYTVFSGVCAFPETTLSIPYARYSKYFEVFGDGKLLYTSPVMSSAMDPQEFTIDITGVQELTIQYPATGGPNETATIFDAKLD